MMMLILLEAVGSQNQNHKASCHIASEKVVGNLRQDYLEMLWIILDGL